MSMKAKRDEIVAGLVAGAAFIASAAHIVSVAEKAGNHVAIAGVHALGIDGLIYIGIRAMQRGSKGAGAVALIYGASVSLIFNAASYGAFAMPKIVIAFTMPVAMLLAFLVVHAGHKPEVAEDSREDTATRTHVRLDVQRESVPVSRPAPVRAQVVPAEAVRPGTLSGEVVQRIERPAIERKPAARTWDVAKATELIEAGQLSNEEIGAMVGTSAKTIQRLKRKIKEG